MRGVLDRAIRELREETAVEADGAITWQRIEAGCLHRKARVRFLRRMTTLAALASLMGGGALAATLYVRARPPARPNAVSAPREQAHFAARGRPPTLSAPNAPSAPSPPLPSTLSAPPTPSPTVPAAAQSPPNRKAFRAGDAHARLRAESPATHVEAESHPAASEAATPVYAAAHEAHFVARDWPRALQLWNRYLDLAPTGPLAPEAHFNRAMCLLRQGRLHEAAIELGPFAAGQWGGYRQSEAAQLLAAMPEL